MFSQSLKPVAIAVSLSLAFSGPLMAQQQSAPAGAGAASGAAVGGVTVGAIGAAVAVVAAAAALSGGSGGSAASASGSAASAATSASTVASQARTANTAINAALNQFSSLAGYVAPADLATLQTNVADTQSRAEAAASNLTQANQVSTLGVVNPITGARICAATNTCTAAEKLLLAYEAARLSKAAVEATLVYLAAVEAAGLRVTDKSAIAYASGTAALASAYAAALLAQTAANDSITSYNALATALGLTGTTIAASSGTTGSIGASGTVAYGVGAR